ncbi:chromate transporter [uncultured Dialister sp.]|jgi:chromate transporter|uniref:chromate transporter n=1 Tax=uncultured Dialister sp. TaxID=278064 RepID=UPI0025F0B148|nr:chromate transporter [uncultured Dialister sp.]
MKLLIQLFLIFAKMGAVTFGGGYAMLPILQREVVDNHHWATDEELMDYYALGQVTPGMIAVNVATFIGLKLKGFWGGLFATIGVITPSMIIITVIALFLTQFEENPYVVHAFTGIRACVCILILDAVIKLGKKSVRDKRTLAIFLLILAVALFAPVSPVFSVVLAGVVGFFLKPSDKKEGASK